MKILYIHQYFRTPAEGGAIRSYHLAKALAERGHEVDLITTHNEKTAQTRLVEGVRIHYLPVTYNQKMGVIARTWAFVRFIWKAYRKAASIKNIDRCYATSTPLTVGYIALLLKRFRKIPFDFEVRDLWPEAPIQMGKLGNPIVRALAYWLERRIYLRADRIIALSPGMEEGIRAKVPQVRLYMIPNFSDMDFYKPHIGDKSLRQEQGLDKGLLIGYFGSIGEANHLEYLLNIAQLYHFAGSPEVQFVIVGGGSERERIEILARERKLTQVKFLPYMNKEAVARWFGLCDAVYVSFLKRPVLATSSPNKFFDGLAAGKMMIVNTEGWLKELVETQGCGFYADPDKPEMFKTKLQPYLEDRAKVNDAGANARKLAEDKFSKQRIISQFVGLFEGKNS